LPEHLAALTRRGEPDAEHPASGLPYALGAHVVWGSMPLYLLLVQSVPPLEFVAWRLVFTLPLCLASSPRRAAGASLPRCCAIAARC
jgi:chloramphenicol-sensitive protein RarD